jgi:acetoin utilization deacetylase AcuC-like enzyme
MPPIPGRHVTIVFHPDYLTGYSAVECESPERVASIMRCIGNDMNVVTPAPCEERDLLLCHSEGLVMTERMDPVRYRTALLAAGGAIRAAELALEGFVAFGVLCPPGHHANPGHNWGFCIFNNIAIAVRRLLADGRIRNAVILDIDLHCGDGTEEIFRYSDSVELINIQAGSPGEFLEKTRSSLEESVPRADILAISAGFDQYVRDWGKNLDTVDFYGIGLIAGDFARRRCGGAVFGVLEGGYYTPDLGLNCIALLNGLHESAGGR